jgi:hypothetical protein
MNGYKIAFIVLMSIRFGIALKKELDDMYETDKIGGLMVITLRVALDLFLMYKIGIFE